MLPAVAFAYEHPELDIMERKPRHAKRDHLVGLRLMGFAYMQTGLI
jgi:non-gastric H+/K+-exchanging ATPase